MTDEEDKVEGEDSDLEELDWDDALADWEDDLDDKAEAKAAPMPQRGLEPAAGTAAGAGVARPLYRPPSPDDTFARRPSAPKPPAPRRPLPADFPGFDEDEGEEIESTKIAAIPQELIASLVNASRQQDRPTKPPPPALKPRAAQPPPVELDFDGLLDGLDEDTRSYDPAPVRAPSKSPSADDDDVISSFAPPKNFASPSSPFFADDEDDEPLEPTRMVVSPLLAAEARAAEARATEKEEEEEEEEPLPKTRMVSSPLDSPLHDDDDDEPLQRTRMVASPLLVAEEAAAQARAEEPEADEEKEKLPRTRMAPSPLLGSAFEDDDEDESDQATRIGPSPLGPGGVGIPKPGGPTLPRPSIPRPGGMKAVGVPSPSIPKPGIPRPGLPRPAIPKPMIPRPGGLGGLGGAKLPRPLGPGLPKPPFPGPPGPGAIGKADLPKPFPSLRKPTGPEGERLPEPRLPSDRPTPVPTASAAGAHASFDDDLDALLDAASSASPMPTPPEAEELSIDDAGEAASAFGDEDTELGGLELDTAAEPFAPEPFAPEPFAAAPIAPEQEDDLGGEERPSVEIEVTSSQLTVDEEDEDEMVFETSEAGADEDEDEMIFETSEEGDEDEEMVFEAGEDEDDDVDWDALEAEQEVIVEAEPDRGALAARRSVRSRKPRDEVFPMVGDGPDALRLRKRLLLSLGGSREGSVRARLLVSAAELAEQVGEADDAREAYRGALEADPTDVVALRALRRDAVARGEWDELASLYRKEAALDLSPWERALAFNGLAEVLLGRKNDPAGAEAAALAALAAQPSSIAASLLLAEARWRQNRPDDAVASFAAARDIWDDPDARAVLALEEARLAENAGDATRARELFTWANEIDPEALDGWFGRARTASRPGVDPRGAVEALATIAAYCGGPLGEAILTRASRVATRMAGDATLGMRLLGQVSGVLPLQARAEAAGATGDAQLELSALEAWAGAAGGTDRALALVRLAEARAAVGDIDGADSALRDASLADGSLGTIRVVREVIARRSGDVSRLVDAVESGGSLAAAALVARDVGSIERERELLRDAVSEGTALVAADVLGLDVAAARDEAETLDTALRRQADRVPPEQRAGTLLVLTERAVERDELDAAEVLLSEARQVAPGNPLVLRPLARLVLRRDATEAASLWLEEAAGSEGSRSAYAATQAGRILAIAEGDAMGAYRRALDAVPGYGPAAWALKPLAMELGDPLTLGEIHEQLAETAPSPEDAAGHLVRGALLRAEADPKGAGALLDRARSLLPADAVLQSLLMRLAGTTSPAERAKMLVESAMRAPKALGRVFHLQAANAFEDADDAASAAEQYRQAAAGSPDDPIVNLALDRAELDAGEVGRVAERRFAAVKNAESDEARVHALERLADLDLHERRDPASAVLSLQSILETAPGHLPSLRALQRYFSEHKRADDVRRTTEAMAAHVQEGGDVTAHLRLARRLAFADPAAPGEIADELLIAQATRAELDLWLAPRVLAAALATGKPDEAKLAARALASLVSSPLERASARVRAAELVAEDDPEAAEELLREAVQAAPLHPRAAEALAEACLRRGDAEAAAEALELGARASQVPSRAAALFYQAGTIWLEKQNDVERARGAFELASERDVTFGDLFERLQKMLQDSGDHARLADLYQQRLSAGGDTPQLVELYVKQAELRQQISDTEGAKSALRSALALSPERLDALRSLANMCLDDEDWRGAAEVLIRIARIRKEREELRWVFFTLGDIYDRHMPDPQRAEAAFKRVLKLLPQDVAAMERLAKLYERENQLDKAAEVLAELARFDADPDSNREHRLELAQVFEQLGDARKAEQVLDEARKNAPTDLAVLRALAQFYQRQNASNALAMHLNRAVNDFRHALEADLGDAAAWPGLVEVLGWRGYVDSAAAAASAAQAIGLVDVEMSKLVDSRGAAPSGGQGAASDSLDEILAPPLLNAPTRAVFKLAGEALEKALAFDVAAYRAEKIDARDTSIRPIAMEVGRWFGTGNFELYVTSAAPRVCVPVYSNPITILLGSELVGITDDREKLFVLVRAFKIAKAQLSVVVRAQPHEVLALMGGLVQSYDVHHAPAGVDPNHIAEAARRVAKHVSRKARDELGPLVYEMSGRPGYEPARLAMAASEWGNRVALVASGSVPAAMSALAKLSGERELPADPTARIAMLQRFPEAASLLAFAVSDAHFEARKRAGIGRG